MKPIFEDGGGGVEEAESVVCVLLRDAAASRAASSCLHAERVARSSAMALISGLFLWGFLAAGDGAWSVFLF